MTALILGTAFLSFVFYVLWRITWPIIDGKLKSFIDEFKDKKANLGLTSYELLYLVIKAKKLNADYTIGNVDNLMDHADYLINDSNTIYFKDNKKIIILSDEILFSDSISSLATAAHELGHAVLDQKESLMQRVARGYKKSMSLFPYYLFFVTLLIVFTKQSLLFLGILLFLLPYIMGHLFIVLDECLASKEALAILDDLDPPIFHKDYKSARYFLFLNWLTYLNYFLSVMVFVWGYLLIFLCLRALYFF